MGSHSNHGHRLNGTRVLVATTGWLLDRRPLPAVRSLAGAGATVDVASDRFYGQAFYSRFCRRRVRYPSPSEHEPAFVEALHAIARRGEYDVILPISDYPTLLAARHKRSLEAHVRLPCPEPAGAAAAVDKLNVARLADALGLNPPRTWWPEDADDARRIFRDFGALCVLKLRRGAGGKLLRLIRSEDDLTRAYEALPPLPADAVFEYRRPILQEHIPGQVRDAVVLMNRARPRAWFTKSRPLRTRGTAFETMTTREPHIRDRAVALLQALEWHGPASVEFIVDERDGTARPIEINARYDGSLALAIAAGVDLPVIACRMALEGDVEPVEAYEVGLRYRWPIPMAGLYLASQFPRLGALRDLVPHRGTRTDLRWDDPLPHVVQLLQIAPAWLDYRRRVRRRRRRAAGAEVATGTSDVDPAGRTAA